MKTQLIIIVAISMLLAAGAAAETGPTGNQKFEVFHPTTPINWELSRDTCTLFKHDLQDTVIGFSSDLELGDQIVTYFDPVTCGTPTYPFEIKSLSFTLVAFAGYHWPLDLEIVVYSAGDPCDGPAAELCRFPITCIETEWKFPEVGTANFPDPCCIDGPFFVGIEYVDTTPGTMPSIAYDYVSTPDSCDNWQWFLEDWYEWYEYWWPYMPGYPIYWVGGDAVSSACCTDLDDDDVCDSLDNCPTIANTDQADADSDGHGDVCDNCPNNFNPAQADTDLDGFADSCDNCPGIPNPAQTDTDGDDLGDACDACPNDPHNDIDGDGICGDLDNCPGIYNPGQEDSNSNGIGDACENCCLGIRGNVNFDVADVVNIADLTYLVAYLFGGGPEPPCAAEGNVNGDVAETINIADLTGLVAYLFGGGSPPANCP